MSQVNEQKSNVAVAARFVVCLGLLIAWMLFIFMMSGNDGEVSQGLSDGIITRTISSVWPGYGTMTEADQIALVAAWSFPVRKLAHFTEYLILAILSVLTIRSFRALRARVSCARSSRVNSAAGQLSFIENSLKWQAFLTPAIFCVLCAAFDEFHQTFVDGRSGQIADVCLDSVGALAGIALFAAIAKLRARKRAH